jgi:beta-lactamase class A
VVIWRSSLPNALQNAISSVDASLGIAAKHIRTGVEITHNANDLFFTASTLKIPLLTAMYRMVDRGEIDPSQRIELTAEMCVPGSGVLKNLGAGIQPTLHDLATLMIIISDNTATDIIFDLVGKDEISTLLEDLGLTHTRIPMTTKQLLFSIVGLDPNNPMHTFPMASEKLSHQRYEMDADGFSLSRSDVASPSDMCRLLELIYNGEILSDSSRAAVLNILKRQQLNNVIPLKLPVGVETAHKTGSYHGVRCDVGIVYSPGGPYTVAIMAKEVSGISLEIDLGLAAVSLAIYEQFNG